DIDSDTAYWVRTIGSFCPWSGFPLREIPGPVGKEELTLDHELTLYPNPAAGQVQLHLNTPKALTLTLTSVLGKTCQTRILTGTDHTIDLTGLAPGIYFLNLTDGEQAASRKLLVENGE